MFAEQSPTRTVSRCQVTGLASLRFGGITLSLCEEAQGWGDRGYRRTGGVAQLGGRLRICPQQM